VDRLVSLFYLVVLVFDREGWGWERGGEMRDGKWEAGDGRREMGDRGREEGRAVDEKDDLTARSTVVMAKGMQKDS
jgi:hypothetical protein